MFDSDTPVIPDIIPGLPCDPPITLYDITFLFDATTVARQINVPDALIPYPSDFLKYIQDSLLAYFGTWEADDQPGSVFAIKVLIWADATNAPLFEIMDFIEWVQKKVGIED